MSDPFLAEIRIFALNFPVRGWAQCDGQSLPISQNSALFSLLGTTYGGDGRTTFHLPELRGRFPLHYGNGPGLPDYNLGAKSGSPETVLNQTNLPSHTHQLPVTDAVGDKTSPVGHVPAKANDGESNYATTSTDTGQQTLAQGNNVAFSNMPPYLALNFQIAMQGIFPSRS